jgi:hypothetical protein
MRKLTQWYRLAAMLAVVGTAGCKSLEVTNPNAPDAERAFSDPGAVAGLVTGAMRNWVQTRETYDGALVLSAMADAYTASWNNFNLRYYTSYGVECPERCGWDNRPTSAFRIQVETFWYGYYGLLSAVNDVLTAIRVNDVVIGTQANTDMLEAVSVMLQGVVSPRSRSTTIRGSSSTRPPTWRIPSPFRSKTGRRCGMPELPSSMKPSR